MNALHPCVYLAAAVLMFGFFLHNELHPNPETYTRLFAVIELLFAAYFAGAYSWNSHP